MLCLAVIGVVAEPLRFSAREIPGRYYQGDGLGVNLTLELKPNGTFDFSWHGCLGEYDRNFGSWELRGDKLFLQPKRPHEHKGFAGMDVRFFPVKWGKRILLIDEYEMAGFAASAKEPPDILDHPREYSKLTGDKFEFAKVQGRPIMPLRFDRFYDHGAVRAKVVSIRPNGRVELAGGWSAGLRPGLRLASDWGSKEVEITTVQGKRSFGRLWYVRIAEHPLTVGEELSSGGEWQRPSGTGSTRFATYKAAQR